MFKKRNGNNKKVDLTQEAADIGAEKDGEEQKEESQRAAIAKEIPNPPSARTPIGRPRPKAPSLTL
jgi:hypothetical protein